MSPWVRLSENALDHPKLLKLVDYRRPLDLWVWGLSYAQKHLTDGFIPADALPAKSAPAMAVLIEKRLWESADGGVMVHDYHQWNDSRETVLKKRAGSKGRAAKSRDNLDHRAPHDAVGRYVGSSSVLSERESERKPLALANLPTPDLAARARELLETYAELYTKHRHGAKLRLLHTSLEFSEACRLCETWPHDRLVKLADIFLTTDDEWISGTDRSFTLFAKKATWCDDRLSAWEADRRKAAR